MRNCMGLRAARSRCESLISILSGRDKKRKKDISMSEEQKTVIDHNVPMPQQRGHVTRLANNTIAQGREHSERPAGAES